LYLLKIKNPEKQRIIIPNIPPTIAPIIIPIFKGFCSFVVEAVLDIVKSSTLLKFA
jgi:hypothetical protein